MQVNRPLSFVPAEVLFCLSTQTSISIYLPTKIGTKLIPSRSRQLTTPHIITQGVSLKHSLDFFISLICGVKSCHMSLN